MFNALLGQGAPSVPSVPLDPGTQGLITSQVSAASNPNLSQAINSNVAANAGGQLQTAAGANQEAAGTGQNAAMLQAIRNQYNGVAGKQIQGIVNNNNFATPGIQGAMLTQANAEANAMQSIANQQQQIVMQANNAWQAARASALSGILGAAGKPLGAAIGMGMAGGGAPTSVGTAGPWESGGGMSGPDNISSTAMNTA